MRDNLYQMKPVEVEAWPVRRLLYLAENEPDMLPEPVREASIAGTIAFMDECIVVKADGADVLGVEAAIDDRIIRAANGGFMAMTAPEFGATFERVDTNEYAKGTVVVFRAEAAKFDKSAGKPAKLVLELGRDHVEDVLAMVGKSVTATLETDQTVIPTLPEIQTGTLFECGEDGVVTRVGEDDPLDGDGSRPDSVCPDCEGDGRPFAKDGSRNGNAKCKTCSGTGVVPSEDAEGGEES
jgi:hypothetical protein